MFIKIEIM